MCNVVTLCNQQERKYKCYETGYYPMRYPRRNPVATVLLCCGYLMRQNFHISRFKADIAAGVKETSAIICSLHGNI